MAVSSEPQSERISDAGVPGDRARLVWNPEFNVVLTAQPAVQEEITQ